MEGGRELNTTTTSLQKINWTVSPTSCKSDQQDVCLEVYSLYLCPSRRYGPRGLLGSLWQGCDSFLISGGFFHSRLPTSQFFVHFAISEMHRNGYTCTLQQRQSTAGTSLKWISSRKTVSWFMVPKSGILEKGVQFVSVLSRGVPLNHDNGSLTSLSLVFPSPCSQAPPNCGRETVWTRRRVWFRVPSSPPPTLPLCFAALNAVSQYHTATVNTHTHTQHGQTHNKKE